MFYRMKAGVVAAVLVSGMTGCHRQQARVDALQKEYDREGMQFQKECSSEYLKNPPTLSSKCSGEKAKLEALGKQLRSERAKQ